MSKAHTGTPFTDVQDVGFFALRTPLLPVEDLISWSKNLNLSQLYDSQGDSTELNRAWELDVETLRARLHGILCKPEVVQAIFVASPSLAGGIEHWKRDPESKRGLQAERALVRYFTRMSSRSTPFGLFAGCSVGTIAEASDSERTRLVLADRKEYRTCSRLDFDYLFGLTSSLLRETKVMAELRYLPNSSLNRVGDVWHYIESRSAGVKRTHHLVKLYSDPYLDTVLSRAENGASITELVNSLVHLPAKVDTFEVSGTEADAYVHELIENEVLVSDLSPLVTGASALDELITQLEKLPSTFEIRDALKSIRDNTAELDNQPIGVPPQAYNPIMSKLQELLPAAVDLATVLQVDMIKAVTKAVLCQPVIDEFKNCLRALCRVGRGGEPESLEAFRQAFLNRYEHAWVPVMEVLDEETGIGFGPASGAYGSPLVRGLNFMNRPVRGSRTLPDLSAFLLRKVSECVRDKKSELRLDLSEIPPAEPEATDTVLPASFAVMATLIGRSTEAVKEGNFRLLFKRALGPSGARLLGRFCHADPELEHCVRQLLRAEEALDAEAIYAEVVYLPEGRIGNVLARPVLRSFEITYLGRSGAPLTHQIPATDLLVSVDTKGRIVLYSRRLNKRVVPRMASAHGFMNPGLAPLYRFLCMLQHEGGTTVPYFDWGPLGDLEFLPRVSVGRVVLSCAQWRLSSEEVKEITERTKFHRFVAAQELRRRRDMPRWIVLSDSDNLLPIDLENALSVDALGHVLKRVGQATVQEMYPAPDELLVTSPEGRFHHELVVPFIRGQLKTTPNEAVEPRSGSMQPAALVSAVDRGTRTLLPGSEWLFAKLYGGPAALDDALTGLVAPLVQTARTCGIASRWFFVRYADPHQHLRIRFAGTADQLRNELLPLLYAPHPLLSTGRIWKVQIDTYEREIERYGGQEAMLCAEDVFFADSEAALEILQALHGDEGMDTRWRIALIGADRLLSDCGYDLNAKRTLMEQLSSSYAAEFRLDKNGKKQLGEKFRVHRRDLEGLFHGVVEDSEVIKTARKIFAKRSTRIGEPILKLRSLSQCNKLCASLDHIAASYVHMHVNRMIPSDQRQHEVVLYDFLCRLYDSMFARRGKNAPDSVR